MRREFVLKSRLTALAIGIGLAACVQSNVRIIEPPVPSTLRTVRETIAAMDSLRPSIVIAHGIIVTRAFLDSLPPDEIISVEVVRGAIGPQGRTGVVLQIMRCSYADTTSVQGRRAVVTRYESCPWTARPTAER